MGIALLKKLNNKLPDSIKLLFSPIIRRKLINNQVFVNQMNELIQAETMTEQEKESQQLETLRHMLIHAYEHTVYYKELFDSIKFIPQDIKCFDDIKKIPILTRKIIKERFDDIKADNISDYYIGETGGSSGEPLRVLLDRESIYREKAYIYHFWSRYGYDYKKSTLITFRGVDFGGKIAKANPLYNEMILNPFIISEGSIYEYVKYYEKYKPDFMHGYPSAIANFCRLLKSNNINLNHKIKAVFLISETCTIKQKEIIEEVMNCKVVAFYGHTERAVFAEQVGEELKYMFNHNYGYTEIEEHNSGNIICTGFVNYKFPLIRYAVDDVATEVEDGSYEIKGHRNGIVLYGKNGERITQTALNFHDDTFEDILGYQFFQNTIGYAECRVLAHYLVNEEKLAKIYERLSKKSGEGIQWKVVQVESFELTPRGKFKIIIQKCEEVL